MKCKYHLCNNEVNGRKGKVYCGKKCKLKYHVAKRRRKLKELAVAYKGGKCSVCEYNKCIWVLEFHHLDRTKKSFGLSCRGLTRSWEIVKQELDKTILVCANCHREIEESLTNCSVS